MGRLRGPDADGGGSAAQQLFALVLERVVAPLGVLGVVFGWWLFIIGVGAGSIALIGWVFEFYRGEHAH